MSDVARRFVASIPQHYDTGLGPVIFADYADDLARRAGAAGATSVLELAAGTGIVSRRLRDALAPGARLVVSDLNQPMLEIARRKFSAREHVEFVEADAMRLPFTDGEFDLLVCQFGVMFFPDKPASFEEAARVVRPGGRYIFNSWRPMTFNPFSVVTHEVTARFFPDDPPGFYRLPFSYGDPAAVTADLEAAGWSQVEHETIVLDKTVSDFVAFARGLVFGNPLIEEIRQRGTVAAEAVMDAVTAEFRSRFGREPATMPLEAIVFTSRRP